MPTGHADYFKPGDWNAVCSMCGFKFKASELVQNWQGMYRCRRCEEPRHPQDFVKGVFDDQSVPWSQPPTDLEINFCSFNGSSAVPGAAIPGCMIVGRSKVIEV